MQRDRRVVDERELSDSEDDDGDQRRDQTNFKQLSNKRKASPEPVNGTSIAETIVTAPVPVVVPVAAAVTTDETTENGSTNEVAPLASEKITEETTEEPAKPTTVSVEGEPSAVPTEESATKEAPADGMDTSE